MRTAKKKGGYHSFQKKIVFLSAPNISSLGGTVLFKK
jgi:hypothetical protein